MQVWCLHECDRDMAAVATVLIERGADDATIAAKLKAALIGADYKPDWLGDVTVKSCHFPPYGHVVVAYIATPGEGLLAVRNISAL